MENQVQKVSQSDHADLVSFLGSQLPASCNIYSHLLYFMRINNPGDEFYFLKHPSEDSYSAIVGLKCEKHRDQSDKLEKSWRVSGWASDRQSLDRVFSAIKSIRWDTDSVRLFIPGHLKAPEAPAFLRDVDHVCEKATMEIYYMPMEDALKIQITESEDVYVSKLESCHAQSVCDQWEFNSCSLDEIVALIAQLPSVGIFLKRTNQLITWAMSHPPGGGISHLFTQEEYRGRGYAKLAIQHMTKSLIELGYVPFATVVCTNVASQQLFTSIGYPRICECYICQIKPTNH